ncbi:MAG TPA: sugar phosphate isomerase/epimerase family protein [Gaiellaceae bacterium]|nr:sugar phosphate isomerase/epimerase family protein [Gaiellaceae bacterium]
MATTPENIRWSEPRFSISQISTLPASFADDLAAYTTAGLDGMGIWELKLPEDGDDTAALEAFAASGLEPASAVPAIPSPLPLPLLGGPTDPQQRIDALCASIHRLAAFGAPAIVCLTGCGRGLDSDRAYAIVVDALRTLAGEAELAGTLIALEPYQAEGGGEWTIVSTIPEALELIAEAGGHSSLGLQFDAWHLWNTGTVLDDVAEHIDRIVGVHVNDYRSPTRGWCDRVLPGDGIAELPVLLGALDAAGWDGLYDLEIFSDDGTFGSPYPDSLWDLPTAELARRGRAAMAAAWDTMRRLAPVGQPQQHKEGE